VFRKDSGSSKAQDRDISTFRLLTLGSLQSLLPFLLASLVSIPNLPRRYRLVIVAKDTSISQNSVNLYPGAAMSNSSPDQDDLRKEIISLRTRMRVLSIAVLGLAGLLCWSFYVRDGRPSFFSTASRQKVQDTPVPDVITAKKFVLLGDNGNTLATLQSNRGMTQLRLDAGSSGRSVAMLTAYASTDRTIPEYANLTLETTQSPAAGTTNVVTESAFDATASLTSSNLYMAQTFYPIYPSPPGQEAKTPWIELNATNDGRLRFFETCSDHNKQSEGGCTPFHP
jgi:hypothetical protein